MRIRSITNISLARKCQILFGAAVLSIIAASLIVPGIHLNNLTEQRYLQIAKESATLALLRANLQEDWAVAQDALDRSWPELARYGEGAFSAEAPRLITVEDADLRATSGAEGFITETVRQLRADRQTLYKWRLRETAGGESEIRLALAVRASEAAPEPGALRGLIESRVAIPAESALANFAVLAAAAGCGAVFAILVFYLVTQKLLLSPVRKLRRLAERVTSGDLEARSTIATGDELEELGNAFNDMLGHLHASQIELQKINRSLDTRLGELAETNVALFESNRLKSEFIANVSHELRTPLVSIIGFAELLNEFGDTAPTDPKRLHRYATNILTSGRMLLDIINDLLDLAKIEAGKLELHLADIDIEALCSTLIDFVTPLADKKQLVLTLNLDGELPRMHSDSGRLKQILYNLLSNAIKFTPEGGSVTLTVAPAGENALSFSVSDTGPGISPDQQAAIFEKFHQLDASHTREYSGTGLGLAITRELATLLGGEIKLESAPGEGATFTVSLPLNAPAEPRMPTINLT